jgi:hypothetical protein
MRSSAVDERVIMSLACSCGLHSGLLAYIYRAARSRMCGLKHLELPKRQGHDNHQAQSAVHVEAMM